MLKEKIIFIGPVPPPYMGPSFATKIILNSNLNKKFELIHLDTSDHRDLSYLGAIDLQNIFLSLKHYLQLVWLIIIIWPRMVYIPISQTTVGYLRDSGFILISKIFGRKVICHLRGGNFKNWYNSAKSITQWFVRNVHSHVDGQIVLGKSLKYMFSDIMSLEKIFVVPNGGNYRFNSRSSKENTNIKILYLSNFIRSKGILETLQAVPDVLKKNSRVEFIFAGQWRDLNTKNDFRRFLEIYPGLPVFVMGPVFAKEKYNLLSTSDIFVFPTYYPPEGHPWVIVEAMAAGLPIISTDQGAITESVIDGVNGFIVQKQNPTQIAEKVKLLIEDLELRKKMGQVSRRLYLENFTEEKMVQKIVYAFSTVLSK